MEIKINEEKNILTKAGLKELKDEHKNLINIERPKVIEEIKDARGQGDLSENAEFDAARERQGQIEDRISEIESIIQNSKVLSGSSTSTKVRVGSEVTIEDLKAGKKITYTIVGTLETDPFQGKISNQSPLAQAILGLEKGDTAKVNTSPKYDVKVVKVNN